MIPLYSINQVREADSFSINILGIPGVILMENASISILNHADEKIKNLTKDDSIGIVCGKGNNGGDGFAVARHLSNKGYRIVIIFLSKSELSGDAKINFEILSKLTESNKDIVLQEYNAIDDLSILKDCSLIFDALLGTGTKGQLKSPYVEIITELNKINSFKIAVDIPSGLDADTGSGEPIFNADLTITLGELKKGLFIEKGYKHSGSIEKGYIGIPKKYFSELSVDEYLVEHSDAYNGLPVKNKDIHKYSAGKVLVIAGSAELPGAAFLTSNAAMKAGTGSVILCIPESIKMLAQSKLDEVIVSAYNDDYSGILSLNSLPDISKRFDWTDVLTIGPGLGRNSNTIEAVIEIINKNPMKKIVIDADGLFALGNDIYKRLNLCNCILTPHHGEFANLIGTDIQEIKKDILNLGKKFVKETECYLVLKGAPTVIFSPAGKVFINTSGNSGMAKFGTGDVLTGIIAGLLAQVKNNENIEKSIIAGVYLHSYTADLLSVRFTEYGITASQILNYFPESIQITREKFA